MECASCGGPVIWMGPLINLTHTECQVCGAINNQIEQFEEIDEDDYQSGPEDFEQ